MKIRAIWNFTGEKTTAKFVNGFAEIAGVKHSRFAYIDNDNGIPRSRFELDFEVEKDVTKEFKDLFDSIYGRWGFNYYRVEIVDGEKGKTIYQRWKK